MALTRKMLKAMGIEDEKIDQIIEAHTETVDSLKEQRDGYKADADKLSAVQKELDDMKKNANDGYKEKYEKEHILRVPRYPSAGNPHCLGFLLSLHRPPSGLYWRLTIVRPFPTSGTMVSADFLQFVVTAAFGFTYSSSARPPRVSATIFLPCNRHIYRTGFGQHWTLCC